MTDSMKALLVSMFFMSTAACANAQEQDDNWIDLSRSGGKGIYIEKCGMCHLEDGMGTGLLGRRYEGDLALLENREDLTEELVKTVVRNGITNMLPMSRGEVSDDQLDQIATYLADGN